MSETPIQFSGFISTHSVEITIQELKEKILEDNAPKRVKIYGVVVESELNESGDFGSYLGIVDDSTERIHFKTDKTHKVKQFVKVVGDLIILPNGVPVVHADILQDFSKLNMDLYTRYRKLKDKINK